METAGVAQQERGSFWSRMVFGKNPAWTVTRILAVAVITVILFKFVLVPIRVTGHSMIPNYQDGQIKFVNKLAYMNSKPKRGDVVAASIGYVLVLKRVVALPGEVFQVRKGELYVNGEKLEEPYALGKIPPREGRGLGESPVQKLGPEDYLLIGDNRWISEGYIKREREIIGRIL